MNGAAPNEARCTSPLLRVDNLGVTAGRRTLVRDVSFELDRGRTLGIVGESGSGKSLTARAVAGLLPAGLRSRGSVRFEDREMVDASSRTWRMVRGPRIGLLLQDPFTMLNPLQTAGTHLAESLRASGRRSRRSLRSDIVYRLGEVGLAAEVAQRYPFQLSGGMRQRVALAAALARDPELLIADEPTTALDVTTQHEVLSLINDLRQQREMSLILITHDLQVAFSVCDRVQVMYAGSVLEQAAAPALASDPAHPYTLGLLLSEPPVTHYVERLVSIPGNVPQADAVAGTCSFVDRCRWAQRSCSAARPPLVSVGRDRTSACQRLDEIRSELRDVHAASEQTPSVLPPAGPAASSLVTLTGVRKTFRTNRLVGRTHVNVALDGVDLHVAEGESVGLVGETGSGKTTIARAILGLLTADAGHIELAGIDISRYRRLTRTQRRQVRQMVQVVFQDPYASLNPARSIGATLREALAVRGDTTDMVGAVTSLLDQVGLPSGYAARRPATLSGGERQRVAIARALALHPRLLVCDEPVAALDVSAQAQVLELLRDIRRQHGMSMLFITHDLSVVRQMADRVVVLYRGQVVEVGDAATVLDSPRHCYTRLLIDAVPRHGQPTSSRRESFDEE